MKLFKKLDNYLLHYYPTIWITRIHSFLPIGLGLALLAFFITASTGWDPRNDMPDNWVPITLMIIPVLIYLVYWFIFQSRYNVAKSGGRMPLSFEYLNFLSYMLVFFMAFLIIAAIPLGNYQRIRNVINDEEFKQDIEKLNAGNALVFNTTGITFNEDGSISYYRSNFIYYDYYSEFDYSTNYNYAQDYGSIGETRVTRKQAEQLISDFIKTFNKYTRIPITKSSREILSEIEFDGYAENLYTDNYYYDNSWDVQYKLSQIFRRIDDGWYAEFSEPWFWKIMVGIMAFLSMLVWIFKQMKLRQFVFGFIALCLTPLFIGIIAVILFEVLQIHHDEEITISAIALLFYLLFSIIVIRAFLSSTLQNTGYVITMYLQFFLPLLPIFLWLFFMDRNHWWYYDNEESLFNFFYWSGWFIGLTSIVAFKPLYAKFRSLPSKN